eukprot:694415-Rhodomonas_salina.1
MSVPRRRCHATGVPSDVTGAWSRHRVWSRHRHVPGSRHWSRCAWSRHRCVVVGKRRPVSSAQAL